MQKQQDTLKFPAIIRHRVQPENAKKLRITLFTPGLLRVHFKNPKRIISTDRYRALRMMRHIQENYEGELNKNQKVLDEIIGKNLELAEKHANIPAIIELRKGLAGIRDSLKLIRAPTKRLGVGKLRSAVEKLEHIENVENGFEREKLVGPACFLIVAFRNKYGEQRPKEIERIETYVKKREGFLLGLRDEFLVDALKSWVSALSNNGYASHNVWLRDKAFSERLMKILEEENEILEHLVPVGVALRSRYNVNHLRYAYTLLKEGKTGTGKRYIREFAFALGTKNPLVAVPEVVEEMPKPFSAYLQEGLERLERKDVYRARNRFMKALEIRTGKS